MSYRFKLASEATKASALVFVAVLPLAQMRRRILRKYANSVLVGVGGFQRKSNPNNPRNIASGAKLSAVKPRYLVTA